MSPLNNITLLTTKFACFGLIFWAHLRKVGGYAPALRLQGPGLQNDIGKLIYFFSLEFLLVPQRLGAFEVAATPDVCL